MYSPPLKAKVPLAAPPAHNKTLANRALGKYKSISPLLFTLDSKPSVRAPSEIKEPVGLASLAKVVFFQLKEGNFTDRFFVNGILSVAALALRSRARQRG